MAVGLNLYLNDGSPLPLPAIAGRAATDAGLAYGVLLALRLAGAAVAVAGLAAAWPGERAADELARLGTPLGRLGVPVGEARAVAGLALRFAPLLGEEAARIARVQALRAGGPPRRWGERLEAARAALVPALVGALERAERVAIGLEARHHRLRPLPPAERAPAWSVAAGGALFGAALLWRGR
jgi:energy-coupling factor transporter transmembrane protein EcfT